MGRQPAGAPHGGGICPRVRRSFGQRELRAHRRSLHDGTDVGISADSCCVVEREGVADLQIVTVGAFKQSANEWDVGWAELS